MNKPETAAASAPKSVEQLRMSCLLAAYQFEKKQAEHGITPDRDKLAYPRVSRVFEILLALILSAIVAGMTLLGSFLVLNVILHVDL
jgi:hypothetical protein